MPTIRESTAAGYKSMIDNYIKPIVGGYSIRILTTMNVQKMYIKIKQEGRLRKQCNVNALVSEIVGDVLDNILGEEFG